MATKTKKQAKRTTPPKKNARPRAKGSATIPSETTFRVVPLPASVRDILRAARATHGTNQAAIGAAVLNLPHLVEGLSKLGIGKVTGAKCKKFRLPFDSDDLVALREASDATGLDATLLLKVLLAGLD
jgi:hypothetical protein